MNIFDEYLIKIQKLLKQHVSKYSSLKKIDLSNITVESPPEKFDFDLSCNASLILAKKLNTNSFELAIKLKEILDKYSNDFEDIQVAGPGFLNLKLKSEILEKTILKIIKNEKKFGSKKNNKKINIEFVSANPTGPMHVGHCRSAIFGDVLSNLLKFNGNRVTKEYYINDSGNQIKNFTKSVYLRLKEIKKKEKFISDQNLYSGKYIIDIAEKILKKYPNISLVENNKNLDKIKKLSLKISMDLIKSDLKNLGIVHDKFVSESNIIKGKGMNKVIKKLQTKKLIVQGYLEPPKGEEIKNWRKVKRLIFKSSLFGDDTDRALQKNDGEWTYFANDVAYHSNKVSRKYDTLINILGADHTGYIKRISAAVEALSQKKTIFKCKVCQLVKLFKDGQPYKMSKRAGDFISVKELLSEVGKDSVRFMMLNRSNDVEIEFDFKKVLEKTKENPVFYVQYCYARINSLTRSLNINLKDKITLNKNFQLNEFEIKILRKIFLWPKVVDTASNKHEPHRIPFYLYDLATLFHSYWSKGNEDEKYRFIKNDNKIETNTLLVIKLISLVLERGMNIIGVSLPKKM